MSNIAKRITAAVVFGLFTAGTPALAAETGVQIAQGVADVRHEKRAVGQTGDAAAPAATPASTTRGPGTTSFRILARRGTCSHGGSPARPALGPPHQGVAGT